MALNNENGMSYNMAVTPAYGNGGGWGGFGGDGWWILLLLLCGFNGGWGGFGMGGMWPMMMGGFGGMGMDYLYPWINNSQNINDGFRDQALNTSVNNIQNAITSGFGDVQLGLAGVNQNICQTGNGITAAINNGFAGAEIAANGRQIANMQQLFGLQAQAADNSCKTQTGIADLKYTVASENCADRYEAAQNTSAIINAITSGVQSIKDDLCADRLDAERRENQNLRTQLSMAQLAASQVEQTAQIRASQATTANQLVAELRSCPIPAQPVFGNQPIWTCAQNVAGNNGGCPCGFNG